MTADVHSQILLLLLFIVLIVVCAVLILDRMMQTTIVLYYVNWCPHCAKMKPVWDEVIKEVLERNTTMTFRKYNFVKVDCEKTKMPEIKGYPTIHKYKGFPGMAAIEKYQGGPDRATLSQFILSN